jgi:futalosine hydrolase
MLLLLLSATDFEINETVQWLNKRSTEHNDLKVELLIGGIGQLQTAYALTKRIRLGRPDIVIQAGIGGSGSKEDLGKLFAIRSEQIADLGLMEETGFTDIFGMGLDKKDRFPFKDGKLTNPYRNLLEWTGLSILDGVTVNEIKSSALPGYKRNHLSVVESMEGAAMHYVCLMEKIPFLQIRSVSNLLGDRDKLEWKLKVAIEKLNESLIALIQKLEKADETLFRI